MAERPLFRRLRAKAGVILPGLIVLALILLLQGVGVPAIDRAGALLFDSYQRAKPSPYRDAGVKIVDIDDETLRRLGQWPWPRTGIAELTQRLSDAGAANIVFDIVFSEPDRTSPARLADRVVPAWRILSGAMSDAALGRSFEGRIVPIGTGAQGLHDTISTPLEERELGVMVHAQALEQIITGEFLEQPDWARGAERAALLLLGLAMALSLPWLGATRGAVLGLVLVGGMAVGSWTAFSQYRLLLDPTWPVLGLALVYVVETALTYYREERRRAYIHQAFDRYLSPELVRRIAEDPGRLELGGEEREMTVLFCDIRGFSRLSEQLTPQQTIQFLIAFLTPMCDILLARKATIDKFIGDAVLAFWNAPLDDPDQYANAARGALGMTRRLREINVEMRGRTGTVWPGEVGIGIGLNAGPCCVGNMGSAQRLNYSLIGDTVNLASRIEGMTKYYGLQIAIGEDLRRHLPQFAIVALDRVKVVGREAPEEIFALLGDEALEQEPSFRAFAQRHQAMLDAYHAQDWARADALAEAGQETAADYGLRKFYGLIRDRVAQFAANPPGEGWDGVFSATEK